MKKYLLEIIIDVIAMFAKGNLLTPPRKDALEQCISFQIMSILDSYVSFQGCKRNQSTKSHRILDFLWIFVGKYAVAVHGWYGDVFHHSELKRTKHQVFIGDVPNSKLVGGFTPFEKYIN